MDIEKMDDNGIIELGVMTLLRDGAIREEELIEALRLFHRLCINATLVQMVANGQLDMSWRDGKLWFSCPEK